MTTGRDRPPSRASCMARRACAPSGRAMVFFTSPLSPPLKKGLISPTTLYDRGYPQTPSEGRPSDFSIDPNPFFIRRVFIRRGFEPLPKPLANRWQGDVIDSGQRPPFVKDFLYGSQSLCPFGASHGLFTSLLSPPLEKGLKERRQQTPQKPHTEKDSKREAAKRRKGIKREEAQ